MPLDSAPTIVDLFVGTTAEHRLDEDRAFSTGGKRAWVALCRRRFEPPAQSPSFTGVICPEYKYVHILRRL
jgi:hypothetical protein